jgi:hypothetical protein
MNLTIDRTCNRRGICAVAGCGMPLGGNALRLARAVEDQDGVMRQVFDIALCRNHPEIAAAALDSLHVGPISPN